MAKPNIRLEPPTFAKDAKPTPLGWVDSKTRELLVSVKLDMTIFEKPIKTPSVKSIKTPKENKEELVNEGENNVEKPKIRGRRKK